MKVIKKSMDLKSTDRFFAMGATARHWSQSSCSCC